MPKDNPKPKGRTTAYAFFMQKCRQDHKKKHPEESVVFTELSKKCSEIWKTLSENDKEPFQEMAVGDKQRYELEMQNYVPLQQDTKRRQKRVKDPNEPKRSLSAFFLFSNDERSKIKEKNPSYSVGDVAKELGRQWAVIDPAKKEKYQAIANRDKIRYDQEKMAYKAAMTSVQTYQSSEDED